MSGKPSSDDGRPPHKVRRPFRYKVGVCDWMILKTSETGGVSAVRRRLASTAWNWIWGVLATGRLSIPKLMDPIERRPFPGCGESTSSGDLFGGDVRILRARLRFARGSCPMVRDTINTMKLMGGQGRFSSSGRAGAILSNFRRSVLPSWRRLREAGKNGGGRWCGHRDRDRFGMRREKSNCSMRSIRRESGSTTILPTPCRRGPGTFSRSCEFLGAKPDLPDPLHRRGSGLAREQRSLGSTQSQGPCSMRWAGPVGLVPRALARCPQTPRGRGGELLGANAPLRKKGFSGRSVGAAINRSQRILAVPSFSSRRSPLGVRRMVRRENDVFRRAQSIPGFRADSMSISSKTHVLHGRPLEPRISRCPFWGSLSR